MVICAVGRTVRIGVGTLKTMGIPDEALALEQRAVGPGETTLGAAYGLLVQQWQCGDRDRDLALHLMFLAWYLCAEPPFLTGMDDEARNSIEGHSGSLGEIFVEVHDDLHRRMPLDPEFNYVVSVMASVCPWACGPPPTDSWEEMAVQRRQTYERLVPQGFVAEVFEGRGFYGDYFAHMVRSDS